MYNTYLNISTYFHLYCWFLFSWQKIGRLDIGLHCENFPYWINYLTILVFIILSDADESKKQWGFYEIKYLLKLIRSSPKTFRCGPCINSASRERCCSESSGNMSCPTNVRPERNGELMRFNLRSLPAVPAEYMGGNLSRYFWGNARNASITLEKCRQRDP